MFKTWIGSDCVLNFGKRFITVLDNISSSGYGIDDALTKEM